MKIFSKYRVFSLRGNFMLEIPANSNTLSNEEDLHALTRLPLAAGHERLAASKLLNIQRFPFGKVQQIAEVLKPDSTFPSWGTGE